MSVPKWQSLKQSADRKRKSADHEKAVEIYTRALALPGVPWESFVDMTIACAYSQRMLGHFKLADARLTGLADMAAEHGDEAALIKAYRELHFILRMTGDYKRVQKLGVDALDAAERTGQPDLKVEALLLMGMIHNERGDTKAAQDSLDKAQAMIGAEDKLNQLKALFIKSSILASVRNYQEVKPFLKQELELARTIGDRDWEGMALNQAALFTPDLSLKRTLYEQALSAFEAAGDRPYQIRALTNSSDVWNLFGLYRRAFEIAQRAFDLARAVGQDIERMTAISVMGWAALGMGDLPASLTYRLECIALCRKIGDLQSEFYQQLFLSGYYAVLGKPEEAFQVIQAADALPYQQNPDDRAAVLAFQAVAHMLGSNRSTARKEASQAITILNESDKKGRYFGELIYLSCYLALRPTGKIRKEKSISQKAWRALELGLKAVRDPIENLSDAGLKRGYLHRDIFRRTLILEWLKHFPAHSVDTTELSTYTALVQKPGRLDEVFSRLLKVGVRLNAERDPFLLPDEIIAEVDELTGAERIALVLLDENGKRKLVKTLLPHPLYPTITGKDEKPADPEAFLREIKPWVDETIETRQGFIGHLDQKAGLTEQKSVLVTPLISQGKLLGLIYCDLRGCFGHFDPEDLNLLGVLANQSAVALENADWSATLEQKVTDRTAELKQSNDRLEQRNNELAVLNSVQAALAAELDLQAIYDAVGDKIRGIFKSENLVILTYNRKTKAVTAPYWYENGQRISAEPPKYEEGTEPLGFGGHVLRTGETLVINENLAQAMEKYGSFLIPGTQAEKSSVHVPMLVGNEVRGFVKLLDFEREHAFSDSDVRLLETLVNSMSVALENARLFDETQRLFNAERERVAELEIINEIQQGLAKELDFQAIVDLVGDKLRQVLQTGDLGVIWYDEKTNLNHYMYSYEHGQRLHIGPSRPVPNGVFEQIRKSHQLMIANTSQEFEGITTHIEGTDYAKSGVAVPIISSDRVLGLISIENYEHEYAFGEGELRLLTTIAASLGTALENARLFDETQRLLRETEQRNAELAIINSVQEGLASKLDMQEIYDLVCNKIREIFTADVVGLMLYDEDAGTQTIPHLFDHGQRYYPPPQPINLKVFKRLKTREPVLVGTYTDLEKFMAKYGLTNVGGPTPDNSHLFMPILTGEKVMGVISIAKLEEHAFNASDVRLLQTLVNSMSVALENARLFDETQRLVKAEQERVAELEIINSIQKGLAAELDFQAIIDLVGDNLRDVFKTPNLIITWYDEKVNLIHQMYVYDHGQRLFLPPHKPAETGPFMRMSKTHQPVVWNTADEGDALTGGVIPGTDRSESGVMIPIISGDRLTGIVQLENYVRENAYGEAELRLLTTIAASLGSALENARLFDETQRLLKETEQRNAELAVINTVQVALAAELDIQGIYDAVGDKIREIFHTNNVAIRMYDPQTNLLSFPYQYENGIRIPMEVMPLPEKGFSAHVIRSRETVVINKDLEKISEKYGSFTIPGTQVDKSVLFVPLIVGDQARGLVYLADFEHENAFSDSDVRLLQTLVNSMSVALENARLFDETQRLLKETEQRNAELAILNSVSEALSKNFNVDAIIKIVGDQVRDTFKSEVTTIHFYDPKNNLISTPYAYDRGYITPTDFPYGSGLTSEVIRTREPLVLLNAESGDKYDAFIIPDAGGEEGMTQSYLGVPIIVGANVIGVVSVQSYLENAYQPSHVSLLSTLAASMGVAIANARQFQAEQERVAELEIINSIQKGLAAELDFQAIIDLVGDKLREVFKTGDLGISWYDEKANLVSYLYTYEHGKRIYASPAPPLKAGIYATEMKTRQPYVLGASDLAKSTPMPGTDRSLSAAFIPIIGSDRFLGDISVEDFEHENAFGEAEIRLLTTIAASLGTALENARLFDETQRLLKETEQRAAELAILNSVGDAMSRQLDIRTITRLVGDKVREIFNSECVVINLYNSVTNQLQAPYCYDKGYLDLDGTKLVDPNLSSNPVNEEIILKRKPLLFGTYQEQMSAGAVSFPNAEGGAEDTNSYMGVPIIVGEQVRGMVSVQSYKEYAYDQSNLRLLSTLASSMGVAIENARLFEETQRLLAETEQRAAELAILNSVGDAMSSQLDINTITRLVGDKVREIFDSECVLIYLYDSRTNILHPPYAYDRGYWDTEKTNQYDTEVSTDPIHRAIIIDRKSLLFGKTRDLLDAGAKIWPDAQGGKGETNSFMGVPIFIGDQVKGLVSVQSYKERAYDESNLRLLSTLASSMGVAIENARLFQETQRLLNETEQRAAELQIINSVQAALAAELDIQGIYDAVGDKIREIFQTGNVGIRIYDPKTNLLHSPYLYEKGNRIVLDPVDFTFIGFTGHVMRTRETLLINENFEHEMVKYSSYVIPGTLTDKSAVFVPLVVGDQARGLVSLSDFEREHAFSDSDVRLLQTLVNSMSVALENARLFDETQRLLAETEQRNNELAIINSVQAALAAELNIQGIYDAVGDKIREIFHTGNVDFRVYDPQTNFVQYPYLYEKGKRFELEPMPLPETGFGSYVIRNRETLVINENMEKAVEKYGSYVLPGTIQEKSCVWVPMVVGGQGRGAVALADYDHEHAFSESDVRLLQTLVNSMSVALENARLFSETQRLLAETEQRNSELAIINSVQAALAAELNIQGIYDAVGDKIREIFKSDNLEIRIFDHSAKLMHYPYIYENGVRIQLDPISLQTAGISSHVIKTRKTLVINENMVEAVRKYGSFIVPGTEIPKSGVYVPLIVGELVRGLVVLSDFEREHAFSDSDVRLLQTLVNSMSVALENARLFNETQRLLAETEQRNSELAIINSVQAALAAELNIQGIYDAVGDKIRQIFHSDNLEIRIWDPKSRLEYLPYLYEKGERLNVEPMPRDDKGFGAHVARTRETLLINENIFQEVEKYGSYVVPGTESPKSLIYVPLIVGDQVRGLVGLSDFEREHAFSDPDVRLLQTLVNSMSVALENARLFDETQRLLEETSQRASELSIINHVSQAMSRQLQVESIVNTVGEQIRDTLHSEVVNIYLYDPVEKMIHIPYSYDRQPVETGPFPYGSGLTSKLLDTKQPLILGSLEDITEAGALLNPNAPGDEQMPQSYLGVPIIVGDKAVGAIDVQSYTECVYDESHVRLLSTLASSMGVALENARLFEETRRLLAETEARNRELAIISRIGQALAGQLDPQGIYDLVGEELQRVFDAQVVAIISYDRQENLANWRYSIEKGIRQSISPRKPLGFSGHILRTREPLLLTHDVDKRAEEYGSRVVVGEAPKSYLGVPLIAGGEVTGVIALQNIDREGAFNENDLRLLSTLALNMGVALENARLYQETQHHAVEMAALAEIGSDIASTHEMEPVLERMATKTRELMKVRDIALYLMQPDGQTLKPIVSQGKYAEETKAQVISLGKGITGSIARSGLAEIVNYPERDPRAVHIEGTPLEEDDLECIMLAPLISRGRVIGVMSVYRDRDQGLFTQLELDFLVSLARQAAIAIESARLYAETERRATEMAALAEVSREISATLELQVVLERIAGQARELLAAADSAVYLLQADGISIKAIAAEGDVAREVLADEGVQLGSGIIGSVVKSGVAEWVNDTLKDPRVEQIPGTQEIAEGEKLLVAPLMIQDRAIGALATWRNSADPPFNQAELSFAVSLAQQTVVAIENARLFESAQESQRRMADIINFLPDSTFVVDREGKVIAWNHAIEEMTGMLAEDILGKSNYEYSLPFYGERRPILIDTVLIPNKEIEKEYAHIQRYEGVLIGEAIATLKGKTTYLNATASALKNSRGEVVGAIESIRDITEQKLAEQELHQAKAEAEAANQAKSAFLAMMSHEIRTPMNAIIGMSGLLMDTTLSPDQREFAETIRSSGDSLLTIINDILDFSKIEAGKMTLEEAPFDLRECIEASLDLIKVRASEKSLELAYQMDSDVPPAILGDVTRLRQVLINLLGNSAKFTEEGEIVLTVAKGDKKNTLHFMVRDTGIGIPADRIGLLFKAFTQADASTSRRYGGTGLGLALSRRIVELMDGKMWVESEGIPGKGSTFHFIISARPAIDWKGHPHMEGKHPELFEKRVLLVDDNATNRRILTLQAQVWGMLPSECASPLEALELLRKGETFDLAILDMQMPEMSGVELADEIRKLEATRKGKTRMPLVLSTSLGGREEARESTEFAAILLKPIRQSALFDMLMTLFAKQGKSAPKPTTERAALDPEMSSRHPLRILLAEDNVVNQKLALRLLSQMGYRADVAANGLEVLQAVKRQPYDVILMDVQMPEMDGLEATRRLCTELVAGERPRIIAMTANAMQGDREMCLEAGMDDYLSKPIRVEELVAALRLTDPLQAE